MGRVLWADQLCRRAGGQQRGHTGAVGVPGLSAVVAELGATALAPAGEAGTVGTAVGNDGVAVGRRWSVLGGQGHLWPSPCPHAAVPSLAQPDRAVPGPSSTLS